MQTREDKARIVANATESAKGAKAIVFAEYQGVTVKELDAMKHKLRQTGSKFQILKKTLLDIALKNAGIGASGRDLSGQIGVAYSSDEVAAAKVIATHIRENKGTKMAIVGGALGAQVLDAASVKALALLPSQDELRGQLVGVLAGPARGFVTVLSGATRGLVTALGAIRDQKGA